MESPRLVLHPGDDIVIATRFWATGKDDIARLLAFLERTARYRQRIIIAINADKDTQETAVQLKQHASSGRISILEISPWGGVTHSLNLMLHHIIAQHPSARYVLFQSVEAMASVDNIASLAAVLRQCTGSVLVAGLALPGHPMYGWRGRAVLRPLSAASAPWNTLAMWHVAMLSATGFPAIADQVSPPGMEEVAAIAVQGRVFGAANRHAVLLCTQDVQWDTDFNGDRKQKHERKMASKRDRVNQIMDMLVKDDAEAWAHVWVCSADTIPSTFTETPPSLAGMATVDEAS